MYRLLFLAVFFSATTTRATEPPLKIDADQLKVELDKARQKHDVPALGAAVVRSTGVELIHVLGVRKRGSDVKVKIDDKFHIGSDTKAMTSLLIATFINEKKLSYDMTLEKALPDLVKKMHEDYRSVTLGQVLSHRAGLPVNLKNWWDIPRNVPTHSQRTTAARTALEAKPESTPGSKFVYSNVGYVIAGAVAERTGNADWETLMKKRVFAPLGMKTAGFGSMGTKGKIDQPLQHDEKGNPVEPGETSDNPPVMGPASRVHCSLGDWGKFIADQLQGAQGKKGLLPVTICRNMQAPYETGYEYTPGGWMYVKVPIGVILGHDGSNTMNYATAALVPSRDLAVLVVTNQGGKKGTTACQSLRDTLLRKLLD